MVAGGAPGATTAGASVGSVLLVLAIGWSTGIGLGAQVDAPPPVLLPGALATLGAALLAPRPLLRLLAVGLLGFVLGLARLALADGTAADESLAPYLGDVVVQGRVVEAPVPRGSRTEAVLELEAVAAADAAHPPEPLRVSRPRVLLRASWLRAAHGDRIEVRGRLARPRSRPSWPLRELLARRGIHWTLDSGGARVVERGASPWRALDAARGWFEANTRAVVPEPHASLVAGIVFGARVGLPSEVRSAMTATGTSHLTAVSGANVALVAGTLLLVATRFVGRAPASIVAGLGVWLYALLVGAPPSALRAATMATLALAAQALGRQPDAVAALATAAALLLAWDPGLAHDLGFQLSAAATAGLILLAPSVDRALGRVPRLVRGQLAVALAAQIATLPIVLGTFQRLSLVAVPANVLAAPTVVPIMGFGALLAVLGPLPGIGELLGWAAWLVSGALLGIVAGGAALPGAMIAVGRAPAWLPLAWYAVLGCWVAAGSADVAALGIRQGALRAAALVGAVAIALLTVFGLPGGGDFLEVAILDTTPGAVLARARAGRTLLLTTSEQARGLAASVAGKLDLRESQLDVVVGPGGVRTGVDLLEIGQGGEAVQDAASLDEAAGDESGDGERQPEEHAPTGRSGVPVEAGVRIALEDDLAVLVVDVREVGEQRVLDLVLEAGGLAVMLPAPGAPSGRWAAVGIEGPSVAVLPTSGVSWARAVSPARWLLATGEAPRGGDIGGLPVLPRREHGALTLRIANGAVTVTSERCGAGRECQLELPPPELRPLVTPTT